MKKHFTYLFLLSLMLIPGLVKSQWITTFHRDDVHFIDIAFPSNQVGYALGSVNDSAFIFKTVNGGNSWTSTYLDLTFASRMFFTNAGNGYILKAGGNSEILHSSDSFKTWTSSNAAACFDIMGAWFPNDSTGYYLLNEGRLHKAEHFAASTSIVWDSITSYSFIAPVNTQVAYIGSTTGMLKTTDGGQSWNEVPNASLNALNASFISADTGYFLVYKDAMMKIEKTTDGGVTVQPVDTFPGLCIAAKGNACISVSTDGAISWSTDGGGSWTTESTGIMDDAFYNAAFSPDGSCYITSTKGDILKRAYPLVIPPAYPSSFILYPNPTQDDISVYIPQMNEGMRIEIYSQLGQRLIEVPVSSQGLQIPTAALRPGVYYLSLMNGAQRATSRIFIKQ